MANTLKLKRSAEFAKVPTTAQLQLGELAVNTYDGRLFTKKNVSGTESIVEFVSNSGTWGISINGNAATATTLQTARTINGTSFNGSANITTASWGTARTLTIGNTGKSVDGSAAVSWSLAEIGALPLTGGTMTGDLQITNSTNEMHIYLGSAGGYWYGNTTHTGYYKQAGAHFRVAIGNGDLTTTGTVTGTQLISNIAQGTAPLGVTSTTVCTNLNADLLDGYHVGTSGGTIPLLNAANTWSNTQTVSSTSSQVLLHSGVSPSRTAMLFNNGANLFVLLSDESVSPSSTYNSLRPFYVNLTTGAVTMAQGVTITNGLTLTGGASITGGLSAYSATNDYTQATVKFGRNSNAYIALHGHGSGNYITHVVSDANPDPFRIALKTETLSWEHVFAMDGHIVPSIGIRCSATSLAPPATSTRSEGTRFVIYNSLGAATVDHAIGVNTNTQWYSIPQQSSRCFKWYAGITPIAALHGDGNHFVYDPGPTTQNTSVTLTDAQIRTCIIQSTPTAGITLTLPTSTNMNDTLWDGGTGMDWSVINLATDGTKTVTLAGNTNHTIVGNAVVAINSSARFRTIKAIFEQNGLPVFTTYRIS